MLAMSAMGFGQNRAKLIWETTVDRLPYYSQISYGDLGRMSISESGNTVLFYPDNSRSVPNAVITKAFNIDGKSMWKNSDFYKNKYGVAYPTSVNNRFVSLNCETPYQGDSTILFDKDYNFSRSFKGGARPTIDGAFYTDFNDPSLIKYDSKGKEQWRYKNSVNTSISILNVEEPYVGLYNEGNNYSRLVSLDGKGKEISISEPFSFNNTLYAVTKNGTWMASNKDYENLEFIRFNNQGRKLATVPMRNIISKEVFEANNFGIRQFGNSNLLLVYLKNNEVIFARVDSLGNTKTAASGCILSDVKYFDGYLTIRNLEDKDLMYSIELPEKTTGIVRNHKIGVIRFDSPNLSWQKEINNGASVFRGGSVADNQYFFQPDNTFLEISSNLDYSSLKSFKVYDISGNLIWKSNFEFYNYQSRITDDYLYVNIYGDKSNLTKIRYKDGKIIWQKEVFNIYNFSSHIRKDKYGNEVIFYQDYDVKTTKYSYKIVALNIDGLTNWTYTFSQNIAIANTEFGFNEGNVIVSTLEEDGSLYKHILRKISPCNTLDPISLTGNTEACPTEKVKLSVPKQDGVTYQWQKDGTDIPNFKDAVYDIGESGTYTVKVKDEICQNQATSNALKISIRSLPNAEIKSLKTTFCEGDRTTISASTNGVFFQWQKDQKDIPNATSSTFEATQAGDYQVGVRDDKCPQVGYSNIVSITLKPSPEAIITTDIKTVIYEPFTVKMTANTGTNLSYQWLKNDTLITNATTNIYEAKKSGKYKVSVAKEGCVKTSEALTISIQIPLANEGEIGEESVQIYPNPNRGEFKIILPKILQNADIQLFDVLGREQKLIHTGEQAQANGLVQGVYFLRVNKGERSVVNKIVIE